MTTPPVFPPLTWYEMRYGPIGPVVLPAAPPYYYGGWSGYWYGSIGMAFVLNTEPDLIIVRSPADPNDARLIPIIDPTTDFYIHWASLDVKWPPDPVWNLFGWYPAGTLFVDDINAIGGAPVGFRKFYVLETD